jgi:hypothetical protein
MDLKMPPDKIAELLTELCVVLGFCLRPDAIARLKSEPPSYADEFTDAVIRAEGLDPYAEIPLHLRRDIRNRVAGHFRDAEDEYFRKQESDVA